MYGRWKRDRFHETSGARGDVQEHDGNDDDDEEETTTSGAAHMHPRTPTRRYTHTHADFSSSLSWRCRASFPRPSHLTTGLPPSLSLSSHVFVSRTALIFGVTALSAGPDLDAASGVLSAFRAGTMASASLTRDGETPEKRLHTDRIPYTRVYTAQRSSRLASSFCR